MKKRDGEKGLLQISSQYFTKFVSFELMFSDIFNELLKKQNKKKQDTVKLRYSYNTMESKQCCIYLQEN